MKLKPNNKPPKKLVGWREVVALPDLDIAEIKVKIDTGAKTSALHVTEYKIRSVKSKKFVYFVTQPKARSRFPEIKCRAELIEYRYVTSSNGSKSLRPVIQTTLKIENESWPIELTLVNRDIMGFRMLLGREALHKKFLVDPSRSFLTNKRKNNS
jgi:hypothetical protein